MTSDWTDTAAAVTQKTQAQVGTKLCVLFKQHLWELHTHTNTLFHFVYSLHKYPNFDLLFVSLKFKTFVQL